MEDVRDNYEKYLDEDIFIHIFATYLLTQFKVKEFYDIIMAIAKLPNDIAFRLYEDALTEDLARILITLYDGQLEGIHNLIEDWEVSYYVRLQGIVALELLYLQGHLERKEVVDYLRELLVTMGKRGDFPMISGIVMTLVDLHPRDSMEEIFWAFEHDMVETLLVSIEDVQEYSMKTREEVYAIRKKDPYNQPLGHIFDELGRWACFHGGQDLLDLL